MNILFIRHSCNLLHVPKYYLLNFSVTVIHTTNKFYKRKTQQVRRINEHILCMNMHTYTHNVAVIHESMWRKILNQNFKNFWEELIAYFSSYDTDRIENDASNNSLQRYRFYRAVA
jgi:hypothetical protein